MIHGMSVLSFDVGMKNLAFCILKEQSITDWNVSEIKYKTNQSLCEAIVAHLDALPQLLQCETVLIEKQPSRNNKMRIIEALLNAYFVIKGVSVSDSPVTKVIVYSAKYKLGNSTMKGKSNYNERKKLSVARCRKFLENTNYCNETFVNLFNDSKKKDDLADCLLQGLAYNKHPIFETLQSIENTEHVKSRKPTDKQERSGNYSRSNIKYLLINNIQTQKLMKAVNKYYTSKEDAMKHLNITG